MPEPRLDWSDLNFFVGEYIPRQTIPILRRFASHIELRTRLSVGIRAGDKKAEIVEKIVAAFRALKIRNDIDNYSIIRAQCEREGNGVFQRPGSYGVPPPPAPTFGGVPNASTSSNGQSTNRAYPGAPSAAPYRPVPPAGPSRNGWQTQANTATAYNSRAPALQDWKPSPMWRPLRALTNMEMLPDILPTESSHTRRERKVHITLQPDIIEKLNYSKSHPQAHPQYSVRIFCTSSDHYKAPNTPYTPANGLINNKAIPIEYPSNPDVYVDECGLPFKDRGLRGKAGSAPPFDLDKGTKGLSKVAGRMTSVSMGHTGPTVGKKKDVSKKFFFQVVYCEITTPTELQNRIDRMIPATAQESLNLLRKKQDDDDDIQFGQSRLRLKDPLASMRLTRPVRSTKCSHLSCFEPKWWILTNEKHPQWNCPLCGRELRFDELIVDGFTLEILATVPEDYDEVVIEGDDNAWHTEDGKYGSSAWMAANAAAAAATSTANDVANGNGTAASASPDPEQDRKPSEFRLSMSPDPKGKRKAIEILSSDDEDEQPLAKVADSRPPPALSRLDSTLSAAPPASRPTSTRPPSAAPGPAPVIDLTLSDSDDSGDEDSYANRQGDRRGPGADSASLPPARALGPQSSIRAPLSPTNAPSFGSTSAPHRPQTNFSSSSRPDLDPAGRRPSWDRPTEPSRFDSNTSNHSNSNDTLQPPRRADTWRPSDRDQYRDGSREKQRSAERPEEVDPYADWDPDPPYMADPTGNDQWDDRDYYSRNNRTRPDHRSNNVTTTVSNTGAGSVPVPRSPKKVARPRLPSPSERHGDMNGNGNGHQPSGAGTRLFDELFGDDDDDPREYDRPDTPELPVPPPGPSRSQQPIQPVTTRTSLPPRDQHPRSERGEYHRNVPRPNYRSAPSSGESDDEDEDETSLSPPPPPPRRQTLASPSAGRTPLQTKRPRPDGTESLVRPRLSSSSLSDLLSSVSDRSASLSLSPPPAEPPAKRARRGPTFDNLFPEDDEPISSSSSRTISTARPSKQASVRESEREQEPVAPAVPAKRIMLKIRRPDAGSLSASSSPAPSVGAGAGPSRPQTPPLPSASGANGVATGSRSRLAKMQKTPRSNDDDDTIDDFL